MSTVWFGYFSQAMEHRAVDFLLMSVKATNRILKASVNLEKSSFVLSRMSYLTVSIATRKEKNNLPLSRGDPEVSDMFYFLNIETV